jgi:hypothetical protein
MARKKQQKPELEQIELPIELPVNNELPEQADEIKVVSPIRGQVRPMPDFQWGAVVTEMRDYVTTHHDFVTSSLQKHRELAAKIVVEKKSTRSTALPKSVILRDDIPTQSTQPEETAKLDTFPRNRRIKPKP